MDKQQEQMINAFPQKLKSEIEDSFSKIRFESEHFHDYTESIVIDNETVSIPYRIYCRELNSEELNSLNDIQKRIFQCYFTRHHNGFVRQKNLNSLLSFGTLEKWEIPYVVHLSGEYVLEIIEDIADYYSRINISELEEFIKENEKFVEKTERRIVSYWNEYYRKTSHSELEKYIGYKLYENYRSTRLKQEETTNI